MEFRDVGSGADSHFAQCWAIYESSFPRCERRDRESQVAVLDNPAYSFVAIIRCGEVVGVIGYWLFGSDTLFVEHLAISDRARGEGLGGVAIDHLKSLGRSVILEIEPIVDETTQRRLRFYQNADFVVNSYQHKQPPFRCGEEWLPLVVLSYPNPISAEEYELFRCSQIDSMGVCYSDR